MTDNTFTPEEAHDLLILLNRVQHYKNLAEAQRAVSLGAKLQRLSKESDGEDASSASE
jgi:predicted DNA-binding transcriptional regulator YafY